MSKEVEKNQANLEDLGWERMEALLDKEMPTRRGFIWWWAFSGAAIVALIASIWAIQYDSTTMESVTNTSIPQQGISSAGGVQADLEIIDDKALPASDNLVSGASVDGDLADENAGETALSFQAQLGGTSSAKLGTAPSNEPVSSDRPASVNVYESQKKTTDEAVTEADDADSSGGRTDLELTFSPSSSSSPSSSFSGSNLRTPEGKTEPNEHPGIDTGIPFSTEKVKLEKFAELPLASHLIDYTIPIEVPLTSIEVSQPILVKSSKRWLASVEVGGLMNASGQKFSWDIGAKFGLQVTKNIAISSGMYLWSIADNEDFSFQEDDGLSDLQSASDVLEPEMPRFNDTVTFVSTDQSRWGQTRTITYLRIPLHVCLMPIDKWSLYAGISYIRLLSNRTPSRPDEDFVRLNQGSEITDLLRTSNLSLDLGMTYRPLEHIHIDLSYLHGTKSYLNYTIGGNGVPAIHRTLRLSLGYQF